MADSAASWRSRGPPASSSSAPSGGASTWGHGGVFSSSATRRGGEAGQTRGAKQSAKRPKPAATSKILTGPLQTFEALQETHAHLIGPHPRWATDPKSTLQSYWNVVYGVGGKINFAHEEGHVEGRREKSVRAKICVDQDQDLHAYGDGASKKIAERSACLAALVLLQETGLFTTKQQAAKEAQKQARAQAKAAAPEEQVTLSNGHVLKAERAREFMEFYCKEFKFGKPEVAISSAIRKQGKKAGGSAWKAHLIVGGQALGETLANNKKAATSAAYMEAVKEIEASDPPLWERFDRTYKPGAPIGSAPHVYVRLSDDLDDDFRDISDSAKQSLLYSKRPQAHEVAVGGGNAQTDRRKPFGARPASEAELTEKSKQLKQRLDEYQIDERVKTLRQQRQSLPVQQKASDVLVKIAMNQVTIVMAATGSGKTTQIPQMLFDDYILQDQGAKCNIFCTQPRRIAAISVAQRVAKERGERLGQSVGYQVRFDHKLPEPNGSITFCTTGVFLRRLQSALDDTSEASNTFLDSLTHIVVDEVHERDVETDLLLVVIKRLLEERGRLGKKEIKLILMSATIDPTLFTNYFQGPPPLLKPAPVVEVPGRSFPVDKNYMDDYIPRLQKLGLGHRDGGWVWQEKNVRDYLDRELRQGGGFVKPADEANGGENADAIDDLELPYPLIALMIADVLVRSQDGHVLVFMPGWDEIKAVNQILQDTYSRPLMGVNFNDRSKVEIHILHSSIPVAEQQAVFDPPADPSTRRVILATNIAETSVTIPDVVYVIDSGRVKEKRYDPERHLSSLVSAWVGTSNLNQRAGRAGRHRPGEYYGVLSRARYDRLNVNQTVEMHRTDLSNTVMHIKALAIPGMEVEDVLDAAIEPPSSERVAAAMSKLFMVGALDQNKQLTALGTVLLQLPVDAPMGKMCLYGAFFRCLDPTLSLAAIMTSRDPFMAPIQLKAEANAAKDRWCPPDFRSDPLTILNAYNKWWSLQSSGEYQRANRFCSENFLSKVTLLQIQQVKEHLFESLEKTGILDLTLGQERNTSGQRWRGSRLSSTQPELNGNSASSTLLTGLIALGSTPNFAIKRNERTLMTDQDKACFIHPSSVCHSKFTKDNKTQEDQFVSERELFAFSEKVRNVSNVTSSGGGGGAMTYLRGVTRLNVLTYMLFGANQVRMGDGGIRCDDWLPVKGHFDILDDIDRLKTVLDACMLRVMEGCIHRKRRSPRHAAPSRNHDEDEEDERAPSPGVEYGDRSELHLVPQEIEEFERLTAGVVHVLDRFVDETMGPSRNTTRPPSPSGYGSAISSMEHGGAGRYSAAGSQYNSRAPSPRGWGPAAISSDWRRGN
ncbi:P-loop containing nucleoside triphosphate hydrolase protein [Ceraceosorus guamensis]|uniref:P-loop containing nucleoside triphosphate hydrolase protein n=1 Tax=Ceraceosorus guamensis TaxID=1522189 RepID=A0A316W0D6_9BASI|nr:P-loop containing nucleoside triphosphate hydrolase protein [Ceraceosorus guamensis]PWN42021.1 P-loop containing nucleoside triphosphate hydrolase protein [Ceraceosorus guamensis]